METEYEIALDLITERFGVTYSELFSDEVYRRKEKILNERRNIYAMKQKDN